MNISISSFATYIPSFFKENVKHTLTPQNKKILVIASLILGCLAGAYLIRQCYLKYKTKSDEENLTEREIPFERKIEALQRKNLKEEEVDVLSKQIFKASGSRIESLPHIVFCLTKDIKEFAEKNIKAVAANCFIKIKFDHGEIKKQFIIKNLTPPFIDQNFMIQQAKKIKKCIENEIQENWNFWEELELTTFYINTEKRVHYKNYGFDLNGSHSEATDCGRLNLDENTLDEMDTLYQITVIDQMKFPREKQIINEEFVPGTLYHDLDQVQI